MHNVDLTRFLVTFALSILATTLVSRTLLLLLRDARLGIRRVAIANCASAVLCWLMFDLWCSTPERFYWFAGHVTFVPQTLWFMWDILHWDEEVASSDEEETEH